MTGTVTKLSSAVSKETPPTLTRLIVVTVTDQNGYRLAGCEYDLVAMEKAIERAVERGDDEFRIAHGLAFCNEGDEKMINDQILAALKRREAARGTKIGRPKAKRR